MKEKRGHDGLTHAERVTMLSRQRDAVCYNCTRLRTALRGLVEALEQIAKDRSFGDNAAPLLRSLAKLALKQWAEAIAAAEAAERGEG